MNIKATLRPTLAPSLTRLSEVESPRQLRQARYFSLALRLALTVLVASGATLSDHAWGESRREPRVINGENAAAGAFPWMVALLVKEASSDTTEAHFCGGSLIGERHVLTAAHCVNAIGQQNGIQVLLGETNLPFGPATRRNIVGYVVHPDYNETTLEHDLAIIKLAEPASIAPVQLANPADIPSYQSGATAVAMGWGSKSATQPIYPVDLQKAQIPLVSDSTCLEELGRRFKPASMICAGTKATSATSGNGVGVCYGDSGGPLVISNGSGGWKQEGGVSWGIGECANDRTRGVFSEVAVHDDFVTSFPDIAPFFISAPLLTGGDTVGSTVSCSTGELGGDPALTITYSWLRNEVPIAGATAATYTLTTDDQFSSVRCGVTASNQAGSSDLGTSDALSIYPAPTPTPSPTPGDVSVPTASVKRFACTARKCQVSIVASDSESGVQQVSATVFFSYTTGCKQPSRCTVQKDKPLKLRLTGGDTWTGSFRYVPRERQSARLVVSAKDNAGNVAPEAAVAVKQLRP